MLINRLLTLSVLAIWLCFAAAPANALTMAECSAKYNSAKDANTLDGQTWNQFRKTQCGTDATAEAPDRRPKRAQTAAVSEDDAAAKSLTAKECSAKYNATKDAGALNGMKWNDFRKSECGPGATADFVAGEKHARRSGRSSQGADDEAVRRQISGRQGCRRAQRHEVERFPQVRMRSWRNG